VAAHRVVMAGAGQDQALERLWVERSLGADVELVEADEASAARIAQLLDASDASAVLLHVDAQSVHDRVELIGELQSLKPHVWIVALADQDDTRLMLSLIRAGARDLVTVGSDGVELRGALERARATTPSEERSNDQQTVALLCARPDMDTSTLAAHLALAMVQQEADPARRTLLVDAGLPAADSLLYLDLKPSYSFVDAARSVRRFDETLIETAFARHSSGLSVLPRPDDPAEMRELTPSDGVALLSTLKRYFGHILVNLSWLGVSDFLLQILQRTDRRFVVVDQSVLSCGAARRMLEAFEARGLVAAEFGLLVDRYTTKLTPNAPHIADLLGLPLVATIPANGILKVQAMNGGTDIFELAPRCPYARAVRELARGFLDAEAPSTPGWGRWLRGGR
jgi:pilus assembly protein CpaE